MTQSAVASPRHRVHPIGPFSRGYSCEAPFGFRARSFGEQLICEPRGDLDKVTASRLRACLGAAARPGPVVVDLTGVCFIDAAGLGALIGGIRRIRDEGGSVAVCTGGASTARLLATAGFDRWVPVVGSLPEALAIGLACREPATLAQIS